MRTRSTSAEALTGISNWITTNNTDLSNNWSYVPETKSCIDVVTPGYRKIVRKGGIVNNPVDIVHVTTELNGGSRTVESFDDDGEPSSSGFRDGNVVAYFSGIGNLPAFLEGDSDLLNNHIARSKLSALAHIDSTPFSFGEDVAELKKSIIYFKGLGETLRDISKIAISKEKLLRKFKRRNVEKALNNLWLQYRFAILPTVRSTMDLMEANNAAKERVRLKKLALLPDRLTARGISNATGATVEDDVSDWCDTHRSVSSNFEVSSGILYKEDNPLHDFRWKYGLRMKDIPTTMWEIVPVSFMIDRVWNIKNSFKGLLNLSDPSINILTAWTRYKLSIDQINSGLKDVNYYHTNGALKSRYHYDGKQRQQVFIYHRELWTPSVSDLVPPATPDVPLKDIESLKDLWSVTESLLRSHKF